MSTETVKVNTLKLDTLLRRQKQYIGEYTVYFENSFSLNLPFFKLGTWKLTKEGRVKYKHLLDIELERMVYTWGSQLNFKIEDKETATQLCDLLWLAHGVGEIKAYDRYIERIKL